MTADLKSLLHLGRSKLGASNQEMPIQQQFGQFINENPGKENIRINATHQAAHNGEDGDQSNEGQSKEQGHRDPGVVRRTPVIITEVTRAKGVELVPEGAVAVSGGTAAVIVVIAGTGFGQERRRFAVALQG